jgi:hypothetical protein
MADNYDFKKVTSIMDGEILTGFMDGTAINVEKTNDDVTSHVGADGTVTFSESNDPTGTITFTLKQTSPSLPRIRALAKQKREFSVSVVDNNGAKTRFVSTQCRIQKESGGEYGTEVSGVEIVILVADFNATGG